VILGIVGAGGLGLLLEEAFQDLNYGQLWTCVYALVLVCAAGDRVSTWVRRRLGDRHTRRAPGRAADGPPAPVRDRLLLLAALGGVAVVAWSWLSLGVRPSTLVSARAREQAAFVADRAWPPATDTGTLAELLRLSLETLQMSVLAVVLATGLAVLLAPVAARSRQQGARRRVAGALCRGVFLLLRAVPAPVWALALLFVMLPGPLPGALALAAYNLGVLGRLSAETVENVEPAAVRAVEATGAGRAATYAYAVLPLSFPRFLAYGLYRWEVAVRETIVVGLVGAGGLGYLLAREVAAFDWPGAVSTLSALVLLTLLVDVVSSRARRALR
jgi:phosphonate transport system permease protein